MTKTLYTKRWRDRVREGAMTSAAFLAPLVSSFGRKVIDVGCGEGHLVNALNDVGCTATGVDGPWVPDVEHVQLDRPPYPDLGLFDVAVCLEVAEHVPAAHAPELVAWLCRLAPVVVFSAAIPGQGGVGHVNEQWPAYWVDLFQSNGYEGTGQARWPLWDEDLLAAWYRQNLLIFAADTNVLTRKYGAWRDGCPPVVHPGIWSVYR